MPGSAASIPRFVLSQSPDRKVRIDPAVTPPAMRNPLLSRDASQILCARRGKVDTPGLNLSKGLLSLHAWPRLLAGLRWLRALSRQTRRRGDPRSPGQKAVDAFFLCARRCHQNHAAGGLAHPSHARAAWHGTPDARGGGRRLVFLEAAGCRGPGGFPYHGDGAARDGRCDPLSPFWHLVTRFLPGHLCAEERA